MPSPKHECNQNCTKKYQRHKSLPSEKTILDSPETYFDLPPDSFWVRKSDENEWFESNAFIQRKSSKKLGFYGNLNHQKSPYSYSSHSHRSLLLNCNHKGKKSLLGLPMSQKSCFHEGIHRQNNKAGNGYLFRSRSEPGEKVPPLYATEPASPQVSCLGKVGTKKVKNKSGIWRSIATVLRTGFKGNVVTKESTEPVEPDYKPVEFAGLKRMESSRRS